VEDPTSGGLPQLDRAGWHHTIARFTPPSQSRGTGKDFDLTETAVREWWVKQAGRDAGTRAKSDRTVVTEREAYAYGHVADWLA
jgi:hypothetical protein